MKYNKCFDFLIVRFLVEPYIIIGNQKIIGQQYFSDLGWDPRTYQFIINDSLQIKLASTSNY